MSGLKKELKIMWGNIWFRSLLELLVCVLGALLFIFVLQATDSGRAAIQQTKEIMGLTVAP